MLNIEGFYQHGSVLYAVEINRANGQVFNTTSGAFEAFNSANLAAYAIALTEGTYGYFFATRPAGIAGAIVSDAIYLQAGGSPALTDTLISLQHSQGDNVAAINADSSHAPQNLQGALDTETQGTVASGTISANAFTTSLSNANAGAYAGLTCRFISGAAAGMAGLISNYNPTGGVITLSGSLAVAPAAGDAFIIC